MDISKELIHEKANYYNIDPKILWAIIRVESLYNWYVLDNPLTPKIRFEGYVFYRLLSTINKSKQISKDNYDICHKIFTINFYKDNGEEYLRLKKAMKIDWDFAQMATRWGIFQILGEQYYLCGYPDLYSFVASNYSEPNSHFINFCNFIENKGYVKYLQRKELDVFASKFRKTTFKLYNYDKKYINMFNRICS